MKKSIAILTVTALVLAVVCIFAGCDAVRFTYESSDTGLTITGVRGSPTEISLPEEINGVPVTAIGEKAFAGQTRLRQISLPDTLRSIGDGAFGRCTALESVEIPGSVAEIGGAAFLGCTSLESVDIPEGVTEIGFAAFDGCESLVSIDIPDSVTRIGSAAFNGCTALESISIPDSVTEIGFWAFSDCPATVYAPNAPEWYGIAEGDYSGEWVVTG